MRQGLLSIVIVSYNVKYFLEQCLYSVQKAAKGIDTEVIVIDNNSTDESVEYLQQYFSDVQFIVNKENRGYGRANNQGWQMATGEYVLFLNPDTIVGEDCFRESIAALQQHDNLGALGIHMIDGSGRFLPESKRGFPSPRASFFKLAGLIKIFPNSKGIAAYYLGNLPEKENNEVEVLTGAYMMVKKEVLEKTGGFDEQFFMYGEDIDLSYRIKQIGYKNFYLASSSIIHFKGESTKKDIAYTKLFYKAMRIFVRKHYEKDSWMFSKIVQLAIAARGFLSFTGQIFLRPAPVQDANKTVHTIIVGAPAETAKAADVLSHEPIHRNITILTALQDLRACILLQQTGEIIFCAGVLPYKSIISCIETLHSNIDYKFYAAESNSMVGSMSKNNGGETVVLDEGERRVAAYKKG